MKHLRVIIEGEGYLSLAAIAECYACEVEWVREVYEYGLLGRGRVVGEEILLSTCVMDRVADVVRLSVYYGVSLGALDLLLEPEREWDEV